MKRKWNGDVIGLTRAFKVGDPTQCSALALPNMGILGLEALLKETSGAYCVGDQVGLSM